MKYEATELKLFTNVLACNMYTATKGQIYNGVTRLQNKLSDKEKSTKFRFTGGINLMDILKSVEVDDNYHMPNDEVTVTQ